MDIIEPHLAQVVPLFRALHTFHAELAPSVYHCDAPDDAFLAILEGARSRGGHVFGHDAGWGLVSYVLAKPEVIERDALRVGSRTVRIDHLYVSPAARGLGLGQKLVARVEDWVREIGFDGWHVVYHSDNPGAADFYAAVGAAPVKGICQKHIS